MKKLLFQKLLKDNFKLFTTIIFSIGLIVWVIQSVGLLDFVTEDGHGLKVYLFYTILNFPKIIHRILPFIFFISLFYQITQYENKNELLVFWINGVKKTQFMNVILTYSFLFMIFQTILGSYISPKGQNEARSYIRSSNMDFFSTMISEEKFIDTVENLTIFVEEKDDFGNYKNIFLKDDFNIGNSKQKSQIIYAKKAVLIESGKVRYFKLFDGEMINTDKEKTNVFKFETINFNLSKFITKTTTFPKIQEVDNLLLIKCLMYDYKGILEQFQNAKLGCQAQSISNVKQELLKRFYMPVYLPLLGLLSCLLLLRSKENKNYDYFKLFLFFLIFTVVIISEVSLRYSSYSNVGFIFFIIFPILSFVSLYIFLINNFNKKF